MNSWKLNSIANYILRKTIANGLDIPITDVYKTIKDISASNVIETKDGKKYKLVLQEL